MRIDLAARASPSPRTSPPPWEEALAAAGFDRRRPAAWLLEGFLFYLPNMPHHWLVTARKENGAEEQEGQA